MADVIVTFNWTVLKPDARQYKQQSIELVPVEQQIVVEIPFEEQYIWNYGEYDGKKDPKPILTPAGLVYAQQQIEQLLTDPEEEPLTAEDWGEDEETEGFTSDETSDDVWENGNWGDDEASDDGWGDELEEEYADGLGADEWDEDGEDWE